MSTTTEKKTAAKNTAATEAQPQKAALYNKSAGTEKATEKANTPFEKLFEGLLKDIYWAEQNLVPALEEMRDAATSDELKDAFDDHRHQTQKQIKRLEKVFALVGLKAEAKKCDAMAGLIKEGQSIIKETADGTMTRDAGLIIAAQKVEHYEIASYGSLVQVALTLGHEDAAKLLEKTLEEEEDTDCLLTDIAESSVNPMADEEGTENDNEEENDNEKNAVTKKEAKSKETATAN